MQRVLGLGGGGVARRVLVGVLGAHRLAAKAAARPVAMLMPAALRHAGCSELTHALAGTAPKMPHGQLVVAEATANASAMMSGSSIKRLRVPLSQPWLVERPSSRRS